MPHEPPPGAHVTYSMQYRRCHKLGCSRCAPDLLGHGPYWFAYWREDRRVRSRYLGRQAPSGVPSSTEPMVGAPIIDLLGPRPWLQVYSLGRFQVLRGGVPAPDTIWRRQPVRTLFACLLSAPAHRLHREHIMDTLWPDADLSTATRALHRTCLLYTSPSPRD